VRANGPNYNCEYYSGSTLYYVDGDRLMALEDGMSAGQEVLSGHGITCVYADDERIYYIVSGKILTSPVGMRAVSGSDVPSGSVLLDPADVGLEKINGFALSGKNDMCFWGQTSEGEKIICVTDRSCEKEVRTVHSGSYFNVQCYGDAVYFVSGDDGTNGYIVRIELSSGEREVVFAQKMDYYTLSDGKLIVCVLDRLEDGSAARTSRLFYYDIKTGKELPGFESFPGIGGMIANDRWVYYMVEDTDAGQTLVYRFSGSGENHQLVFRKLGSYRLYGVAGSYFTLFGDDVYYICNYDRAPGSIVLTEHTVLG